MMPVSSASDFAKQLNTNKTKSTAKVNSDNTVTLNVTHVTGVTASHSRVIVDAGSQTVTFGDGSGVKTVNVDQYLASLL